MRWTNSARAWEAEHVLSVLMNVLRRSPTGRQSQSVSPAWMKGNILSRQGMEIPCSSHAPQEQPSQSHPRAATHTFYLMGAFAKTTDCSQQGGYPLTSVRVRWFRESAAGSGLQRGEGC